MKRLILLDLDGVLADFHGSAMACFGKTIDDLPPGEVWIPKALGITEDEFWSKIDQSSFWRDLKPYPWLESLIDAIESRDLEWCVSTSPSKQPASCAQKVEWLQRQFGIHFRNFLIGWPKFLLARPGVVLVDDWENNTVPFREHGGHGILFPQKFNSRGHSDDPVRDVMMDIDAYFYMRSFR